MNKLDLSIYNLKTEAGRNEVQNSIRALIFTVIDVGGETMDKDEFVMWDFLLKHFSDEAEQIYKIRRNLHVWQH